jgi:hypothetical protein
MSDAKEGGNARQDRQRRLAEALRLNLKRRKAQSRERVATDKSAERPNHNRTGESG